MSFTSLPSALRVRAAGSTFSAVYQRSFHTATPCRASILFALGALSNSRETQHFNKLTRLPRVEHSPPLKLIKTSEVDPFPLPTPPKPAPRSDAWLIRSPKTALRVWDNRALQIGRVFLTEQARQTHRLRQALGRAKRRQARLDAMTKRDKLAWHQERLKLQREMRAAGTWILLLVGTATALATWRFWPETDHRTDSGALGRKIAARAAAAMPLPAAVSSESIVAIASPPVPLVVPVENEKTASVQPNASVETIPATTGSSWWKSLFWKQ